jgi:hypothetical protein
MIDARVYKHRRRLRTKTKVAAVTIGLAVLTLSFLAYSFYPLFQRDSPLVSDSASSSESYLASDISITLPLPESNSSAQHVFPYSVIPGGALSSRELSEAARREPVVAAHYAGFSVADARVIRLPHDKLAYVSYRLGNHIYWTKTKVELHQGEASCPYTLRKPHFGRSHGSRFTAGASAKAFVYSVRSGTCKRRPRFPRDRSPMARKLDRPSSHG